MHLINPQRGEVALEQGGTTYTMVLSLNALAQIEAGLGLKSLSDLFTRLAEAKFNEHDLSLILSAALMAGGVCSEQAKQLTGCLSLIEAMQAVARLFEASFAPLFTQEV